jgi:hypothetical protein
MTAISSLAADMKADKPEGAPDISETQLTEMATNIAEGRRPQGPPPQDRAQMNLSTLAEALGTDADRLVQQLRSGADLSSLLSAATGYGKQATVDGGLTVDRYA